MSEFVMFSKLLQPMDKDVERFEYTVQKYVLGPPSSDVVEVEMPVTAKILCFDYQDMKPCLWALVCTSMPTTRIRRFRIAGTGTEHILKDLETDPRKWGMWHYIGTARVTGLPSLVYHCFEILWPVPEGYTGNVTIPGDFPTIHM